ncbi:hypothetical protein ABFX02_12G053300 [Erythranthe guttata]
MATMFLLAAIFIFTFHSASSSNTSYQTYIVHVDLPPTEEDGFSGQSNLETWYHSFLPPSSEAATSDSDNHYTPSSRIVHMYRNVITGFAAKLSPEEVKEMEKKPGFMHARPHKKYQLHTTHSPNFLGLHQGVGAWPASNYGKGVIIGVIDTGITPGHPSFNDQGMPPPPPKWKGKCELSGTLSCNNKLIGARNFASYFPGPPIDNFGHGTHTASTAAGNFVSGANVFGQANGTASGIAPLAHLAIYKVGSHENGTDVLFDKDLLAGMDAAIEDGVDVLSLSLAGDSVSHASPFHEDVVAIGAFSAVKRGIFVTCSAGNDGPSHSSLYNTAPWILTVGASTTDRKIKATALLGNGEAYEGESFYQPEEGGSSSEELLPLVYGALCGSELLGEIGVKGKVVLCEIGTFNNGQDVKDAGGAAMIGINDETDDYYTEPIPHVLPATLVNYEAALKIKAYIEDANSSTPTSAILFGGTVIGDKTAPMVTPFSSRGPNLVSPGIIKPDIIGPGANILAAWPVSIDNNIKEKTATYNMVSGTSMSCPHLSGVAALVKSAHPDWSPAMVKSAIMTSSTQTNLGNIPILDQRHQPADVFAVGAGHVNPPAALNPGLVYDISARDYISYLCFLYTERQVAAIVNRKIDCSSKSEYSGVPEAQLNYPSFSVVLGQDIGYAYSRTVTNVGEAESTYYAKIECFPGVSIFVEPTVLSFTEVKQQLTYEVYFSRTEFTTNGSYVQGSISWVSTKHVVRIPVSVKLVL